MPPVRAIILLLAALAPIGAAQAQQTAPAATAEQAIETQKKVFGPPNPRRTCGVPDAKGEIVVCATDNAEHRVMSSSELNPYSEEALKDGLPRAPDLGPPSCMGPNPKANPTICQGFGWAPPPIYYIDLKAIPEAPEGSDADLIAKGEKAER